jgi:nucleotide-binding universal stress UspA family protein
LTHESHHELLKLSSMAIKKLLVPLLGGPGDVHTILAAVNIARDLGAHVTVMFSGGHLSELVAPEPPSYSRVKPRLQLEARALLAAEMDAARASFELLVKENRLTVSEQPWGNAPGTVHYEVRRGPVEATIPEAAMFHDLVLFSRAGDTTGDESHGLASMKAALHSCGRPILILTEQIPTAFATSIAIAWNGSIEGMHAVSAALELLSRAKLVHIVTVGTQKTSVDQAQKLRQYLEWHGIAADVHTTEQPGDSVGATLVGMTERAGADLLVLGGYTHSRVQQTIFGGVTHHIVRHCTIPVMLSR